MLNNIKNRKEGFTIIEVLIVLAIAGLILLVVFLAVPALQRNSRNNQRRTDASNLLSAASEYISNNAGAMPAAAAKAGSGSTGTTYTVGASSSNTVDVKLGYFTAGQVGIYTALGTSVDKDNDAMVILTNHTCNGNSATAQNRSVAVVWRAEPGAILCLAS